MVFTQSSSKHADDASVMGTKSAMSAMSVKRTAKEVRKTPDKRDARLIEDLSFLMFLNFVFLSKRFSTMIKPKN